jgi:hypothetical protein
LEAGIVFEAGMNQVLGSQSIYLKVGSLVYGFGHTRHMEHLVDTSHGLPQRGLIATIPMNQLDGQLS